MGNHEIRGVPARLGLRLAMILYNINWQIDIKTCAAELNLTHCADATDCYATNCQAAVTGGKVAFDLTANAYGDWALHCHMLLHMHAGMFRTVTVRREEGAA